MKRFVLISIQILVLLFHALSQDYKIDICTDYTTLSAPPLHSGETGQWTDIAGDAVFKQPQSSTTEVTNIPKGKNTFQWEVTKNGDKRIVTFLVTNYMVNALIGEHEYICDSKLMLVANRLHNDEWGQWASANPDVIVIDPTSYGCFFANIPIGTTQYSWTIRNSRCSAVDAISVENKQPAYPVPDDTIKICSDSALISTALQAVNIEGTVGAWQLAVGTPNNNGMNIIVSPTSKTTWVKNIPVGKNSFVFTYSNGSCQVSQTTTIINNSADASASVDRYICEDSAVIVAQQPQFGKGTWTTSGIASVIISSTNELTEVKNLQRGANRFIWTVENEGCTASDVMIVYNASPSPALLARDGATICDDVVTLEALPPDPAFITECYWTKRSGPGIITNYTSNYTTATQLTQNRSEFSWVTRNQQARITCTERASFVVTRNAVEAIVSRDTIEICGSRSKIAAIEPQDIGAKGWWENNGNSCKIESSTSGITNVTNVTEEYSTFTWWVQHGKCIDHKDQIFKNLKREVHTYAEYDTVCSAENVLYATTEPENLSGYWKKIVGDGIITSSQNKTTFVNDLAPGLNRFVWTTVVPYDSALIARYCQSADTVNVIHNAAEAIIGRDLTNNSNVYNVCINEHEPYDLHAIQPIMGYGRWSIPDKPGVTFEDQTRHETSASHLGEGLHTFVWTVNERGCTATDTIIINNKYIEVDAGEDKNICSMNTVLNANNLAEGLIGFWDTIGIWGYPPDSIFENKYKPNTKVKNLMIGDNDFIWTIKDTIHGCEKSDNITITNNSLEHFVYAGGDKKIISDSAQTYLNALPVSTDTASQRYDARWQLSFGSAEIVDDKNPNTLVKNLDSGLNIFEWRVVDKMTGCMASDFAGIGYYSLDIVNAGPDQYSCENVAQLNADEPYYGNGYWSIFSGDGNIDEPDYYKTKVEGLNRGKNLFVWELRIDDLFLYDTVSVFNGSFHAFAGEDSITCADSVQLYADGSFNGFYPDENSEFLGNWEIINAGKGTMINNADIHKPNAIVYNLQPGVNTFKWTVNRTFNNNQLQCTSKDTVIIERETDCYNNIGSPHESGIYCYPNPASQELFVDLTILDEKVLDVSITGIDGKQEKLIQKCLKGAKLVFPVSHCSNGMYILHIRTAKNQYKRKIVIQHSILQTR